MSARDYLAEVRARVEGATPGPWEMRGLSANGGYYVVADGGHDLIADDAIEEDADLIAHARTDLPRLADAVQKVLDLHREEVRWQPSADAETSYGSPEECREEHDLDDGAPLATFSLCSECSRIEDGVCDGECTSELGYRESLWPCPTIRAVTEALGVEG